MAESCCNLNVFGEPVAVLREPSLMIEPELCFLWNVAVREIATADEPLYPQNSQAGQLDLSHLFAQIERASLNSSPDLFNIFCSG
jgi:hypothetical protein